MQQLKTEITIQIPETHVLVTKVEYEQLKEQADEVWVRGLNWLVAQTNKGAWLFNAQPMKKWLRENFGKVLK